MASEMGLPSNVTLSVILTKGTVTSAPSQIAKHHFANDRCSAAYASGQET